MNRKQNTNAFETLESRQMMSATVSPAVVGYLPDWNASAAMVDRIDYSSVNTVNYFSVSPDANGDLPGTGGNDSNKSVSGYDLSQLDHAVDVAKQNNVKVNIVIGGAGKAPTAAIETVLNSKDARKELAKSVVTFMAQHNLDGVDVDYEPAGPSDDQIANYGDLLNRMNNKIGDKTLSAAVAAETLPNGDNWGDRRYVLNSTAVKAVDSIGIMAYDFTPGEGQSGWNRSFGSLADWGTYVNNVQAGSKSKLQLGLPFYGKAGSSDWGNPGTTGGASYDAILKAYAAQHGGQLPGTDLDDVTATVTGEDVGDASGQSVEWHFNGADTIAAKSENAMWDGAGGVMIWDLSQDYFTQNGSYDQTHSLLPAVKRGLQSWAQANGETLVIHTPKLAPMLVIDNLTGGQDRVADDVLTGTATTNVFA